MSIRSNAILVLSILSTVPAYAALTQAPPNFPVAGSGEAVYVDFETANYRIVYDVSKSTATVDSEIQFVMPKKGFPLFDLIPNPTSISLDGKSVAQTEITDPDSVSRFRLVKEVTAPGKHTLKISHVLTDNVSFKAGSVASAFWTSDLDDRQYLEQYLPASFEYDQVEMHFVVDVVGADSNPHVVRANGVVGAAGVNRFTIDFPKFFTASSVFFHLMPEKAFPVRTFSFKSIDGRSIPVEIYSTSNLADFEKETVSALNELEKDYGAFPHPKVVIYGTGGFTGGMEYSGATMSSTWALSHELFHSYNARSVMPANGNAGWIDEAMSSWRDNHYELRSSPGFSSTKMAGHSKWTRMTDDHAYNQGAYFLAWIAQRMQAKGGDLKLFLRDYFARHRESTVTTEMLRDELITLTKLDLTADFNQYIYGIGRGPAPEPSEGPTPGKASQSNWPKRTAPASELRSENPYHPRLSAEQLRGLLWP